MKKLFSLLSLFVGCSLFAQPIETLGPSSRRTGLVISEIMYNPLAAGGQNLEFIEIYNSEPMPVDVGGYRISGEVDFTFLPNTTIPSQGYLVVAAVPTHLQTAFPAVAGSIVGPFSGGLDNGGGTIRLRNRADAILLEIEYSDDPPWPVAADGAGHSIVLSRPSRGENNPAAWTASVNQNGSPAQAEPAPQPSPFIITEFFRDGATPANSFIEIRNTSAAPQSTANYYVSTNATNLIINSAFALPGETIPANGFRVYNNAAGGFAFPLPPSGTLFLSRVNSGTRVVDAVRYLQQRPGISTGRYPSSSSSFSELVSPTPGAANAARLIPAVVINEIMFNPITHDWDEYIELHNTTGSLVTLDGWRFDDGISFTFPASSSIAANGFVVVARDPQRVLQNHPGLSSGIVFGPYEGELSNRGERLRLLDDTGAVRNEGTYSDGGRWGLWSDGGGSSLELIDPVSDNRVAANWADSDETASPPSAWTTLDVPGTVELGDHSPTAIEIGIMGAGECLIDDVKVMQGAANLVSNSLFDSGNAQTGTTPNWTYEGNHDGTRWETTRGDTTPGVLHVRATGRGEYLGNRIVGTLSSAPASGVSVRIQARIRYLRGHPEVLFRLRGNWLEAVSQLTVAASLGTPGAVNTRRVSNAGPAIWDVRHSPVRPAGNEEVTVTARVHDPHGFAASEGVVLEATRDGASPVALTDATMVDDGSNGDAVAGDGIYTGRIPGQTSGTLVSFYVRATDAATAPLTAASATFPIDAPAHECLVRFGDPDRTTASPASSRLWTYRLWMKHATVAAWTDLANSQGNTKPLQQNSSKAFDMTFVYDDQRAIYNAGAAYNGSDNTSSYYNSPVGKLCGYTVDFPSDDRLMGTTDMLLDWPIQDVTGIRERLAYWIAEQMNLPFNRRRPVHLVVNGVHQSTRPNSFSTGTAIYEDSQQPNADFLEQWFEEEPNGELHKIQVRRRGYRLLYLTDAQGQPFSDTHWGTTGADHAQLALLTLPSSPTTKHLARYRWNWRKRAVQGSANDFTALYALIDAMQTRITAPANFASAISAVVDVEQWMRIQVVERCAGNLDTYGNQNGQNMYAYKPGFNAKWNLLLYDTDLSFGGGTTDSEVTPLFSGTQDPAMVSFLGNAALQAFYWQGFREAVQSGGPLDSTRFNAFIDQQFAILVANGVQKADTSFDGGNAALLNSNRDFVKNWLNGRATFIRGQLQSSFPVVLLNEVQPNNTTGPADNMGERGAWVELYNAGNASLNLSNYRLTDDYNNLNKSPIGTVPVTLPAGGRVVVWLDGEPNESTSTAPHSSFALAPNDSGSIILVRMSGTTPQIVDSMNYSYVRANQSYGSSPEGQGTDRGVFATATAGAANGPFTAILRVNEWAADTEGSNDDWFEIYNAGTKAIDLEGYALSDNAPTTWHSIQEHIIIAPQGFLTVRADDQAGTSGGLDEDGDLRIDFGLAAAGETISIRHANGTTIIDSLTYAAQSGPDDDNKSNGRLPDGADMVAYPLMNPATPGEPNNFPPTVNMISPSASETVPNPVNLGAFAADQDGTIERVEFFEGVTSVGIITEPITTPYVYVWNRAPLGNHTIVAWVTDDRGGVVTSTARTFTVVNSPPTISAIANQSGYEIPANTSHPFGGQPITVNFTVDDVDSVPEVIQVSASSSNPTLFPAPNLVLGGSGANRTLTMTPALSQFGTAQISVFATDNSGAANNTGVRTFTVTITPVNDTPTITSIPNQTILEDSSTAALPFTIGDAETPANLLNVSGQSGNFTMVPWNSIVFGGSGANRTVTVTPGLNQHGTTWIGISVVDDSTWDNSIGGTSFTLTITPVNDAPTLDAIAAACTFTDLDVNAGPQTVPLTGISDGDPTDVQTLAVTATSDNTALIPNPTVSYTSPNSTGTLTFTPNANLTGTAVITVQVQDNGGVANGGQNVTTRTFTVNVTRKARAWFAEVDRGTKGNWNSKYGADGYAVFGDLTSYPSYASVGVVGDTYVSTWNSSVPGFVQALRKPSNLSDRIAGCLHTWPDQVQYYTLDLNLNDNQVHRVAFYFLDWDGLGRHERVDIIDPVSGAIIDTRLVRDFTQGKYLVWNLRGHVHVRISRLNWANAALSGIFFDTVSALTGNTVWVDDALPAGASQVNGEDGWNWVSSPAPFSGTVQHKSALFQNQVHQHYFVNPTSSLLVNADDLLYTYVYLEPGANKPQEVMLQWFDGAGWEYRAYWGANLMGGDDSAGPLGRTYMGPLPAAGQWQRLEVPAYKVGVGNRVVRGMAFTLYGGQASWDYSGKVRMTDTDCDGLPDAWETEFYPNITGQNGSGDSDGDGVVNRNELAFGAKPTDQDSDDDTVSDLEEAYYYGSRPDHTDGDRDGLNDLGEKTSLTDGLYFDSDEDGLFDGEEVHVHLTNPRLADTDGDGLGDYEEIVDWLTNPSEWDSDSDDYSDGEEINAQTDPWDPNSHP